MKITIDSYEYYPCSRSVTRDVLGQSVLACPNEVNFSLVTSVTQCPSQEEMLHISQITPSETRLVVVESSVNQKLSVHQGWVDTITTGFFKFQETKKSAMLPSCISAFEAFEQYYQTLYQEDPAQAKLLKEDLEKMRGYVQEMNMTSSIVTRQDLSTLANFFKRPIEKEYIDPITKKMYVQPNHSKLLPASAPFFNAGKYTSVGLSREKKLADGRICDMLYVKKGNDQIRYEKSKQPSSTSWLSSFLPQNQFNKEELEQRIQCQKQLFIDIRDNVQTFKSFGYSDFIVIQDDHDLSMRLGLAKEASIENHIVLFIYQEINKITEAKE